MQFQYTTRCVTPCGRLVTILSHEVTISLHGPASRPDGVSASDTKRQSVLSGRSILDVFFGDGLVIQPLGQRLECLVFPLGQPCHRNGYRCN